MEIQLNGKVVSLEQPCSLRELLEREGALQPWVAVAVDGCFVPRSKYDSTLLRASCSIELLQPAQGG